ncbi:hypothetical protein K501DRAFT_15461 [Backusella circina FSU 941]|nr:hypothetical protein K501DRAFT_15461 [Backusella circina FSU 941]
MIALEDRNKLLKWGLNDREKLVRAATGKMLSTHWIRHANNNLIEFLERLEIMKSDVAEDVLNAFFSERLDIINEINFDAEFWKNLTPESAFLSKVFIKFLKTNKHEERLDSILPEVTRHAFNLENYNNLWRISSKESAGDYEFITTQMLDIALYLDYGDEVGRRKIFELLREILKSSEVPDEHLKTIVNLFRIISLDERDFTRTMIEIISDIQEQAEPYVNIDAELGLEGPSKRARADNEGNSFTSTENNPFTDDEDHLQYKNMIVKLRCLSICKNMLENSQESLQDNTIMYGLLNDLIVPSVQSSEVLLREEGLHCLGLCCCLDKTLAEHNVSLFIHCIKNGHEGLQVKALKTLCDLMMTYGIQAINAEIADPNEIRELFEFCLDHDSQSIQAIAAEGLAKLMLARRFKDDEILRLMVLLYFFPVRGNGNLGTQQCLSYFFPAYCYSSPENQKSLVNVTVSALEELCNVNEDLEENETMVAPVQISDILADWTDPRKIAKQHITNLEDHAIEHGIQEIIAIDALKIIFKETGLKRKVMCHILQKLYLDESSEDALNKMIILANHITSVKYQYKKKLFFLLTLFIYIGSSC